MKLQEKREGEMKTNANVYLFLVQYAVKVAKVALMLHVSRRKIANPDFIQSRKICRII